MIRYGIRYKRILNVNIIFTDERKVPLHEWSHIYMSNQSEEDLVELYNKLISRKANIKGIAAVPNPASKAVFVDIDEYNIYDPKRISKDLHGFLVHNTARGGVRLICNVENPPYYMSLSRGNRRVGEIGGTSKHAWHMPPSSIVNESGSEVLYRMFYAGSEIDPAETPKPDMLKLEELIDTVSSYFSVDVLYSYSARDRKISVEEARAPVIYPPLWRDMDEFRRYVQAQVIPLPRCVSRAVASDEVIRKGERFIFGSIAVIFMASLIAEKTPEEVIKEASKNLEMFPEDQGETMDQKFSRLMQRYGRAVIAKYSPFTIDKIPSDFCRDCIIYVECRIHKRNMINAYIEKFLAIKERLWNMLYS